MGWGMILEKPRPNWGMIMKISPVQVGNDSGNTWGMILENDKLIFDVEHAVKDLFAAIEAQDPHHWTALMQAVEHE